MGRYNDGKMLHNETYAGVWYYGKHKRVDGKRVQNPPSTWLAVQVPAIVDHQTWEEAQVKMKENHNNAKRNTKYQYLLQRRAVCSECGTPMNVVKSNTSSRYEYYRCPVRLGVFDYAKECGMATYFRADHVDMVVSSSE